MAGDGRAVSGKGAAPGKSVAGALVFGFAAQAAVALIGVAISPLYLRLMGPEAFGLVTFLAVLQAWMLLFDLGLSPTLARQLSRFRAGALSAEEAMGFFHGAELLFVAGGLAAAGVFLLMGPWVGGHWLGRSSLPRSEVDLSLRLIGVLLVFRWLSGLYQTALVGLERQVIANALTAAGVFARAAVSLAILLGHSRSPTAFFLAQATLTVAEALVSRVTLSAFLPRSSVARGPDWTAMRQEAHFAAGMVVSTLAAMLINQIDRLALSHALSLREFGLFGLVAAVCTGIAMIAPPFAQAFQPRLTALMAQDRRQAFVQLYRQASSTALVLSAALAGSIAAQPVWVLLAWTGDASIAGHLAPVLTLYAAGGAIAVFLFAPYLLQYAQGSVRLHALGNVGFGLVWIPAAVWAAFRYGPMGSGTVWLAGNALYLVIWIPIVHRTFLTAEERRGLDVGTWLRAVLLAAALAATRFLPLPQAGRLEALVRLGIMAATIALAGVLISPELRAPAVARLNLWRRQASAR